MKLNFDKIDIKTSDNFKSQNFDIGDKRVIFDILRGKMYANPTYSICQEVMSNSRDANREIGREDTPITIKIPNSLDESLQFKDNGPGISPDRMANVFLKYGNSTKRSDNFLTGGFGLGAKTPFAYTDTFTIITVTEDDDGKKRERSYIAYIDDSRLGAISEVDTHEVDESTSTGTTISIQIAKKDFKTFIEAIKNIGSYWKVRPNIEGGTINWHEHEYAVEGSGWGIPNRYSYSRYHRYNYNIDPVVLIDEIPYTIRKGVIYPQYDTSIEYRLLNSGIHMHFEVGEVDVTAPRDDLDYSDKTIEAIRNRLKVIKNEIKSLLEAKIANKKNIWDASIAWHDIAGGHKSFVSEPEWNGLKLLPASIGFGYNHDVHGANVRVFQYDSVNKKVSSAPVRGYKQKPRAKIYVDDEHLLVENDEDKLSKLKLQTLFERNPDKKYIGVVQFLTKEGRKYFNDSCHWDKLEKEFLSKIPKAKNPRKRTSRKGKTYSVNAVKELKSRQGAGKLVWEWHKSQLMPDDKNGGAYVLIKNNKPLMENENGDLKPISRPDLGELAGATGIKIYGILWKYRKKMSKAWKPLKKAVGDSIEAKWNDEDIQELLRWGSRCHTNSRYDKGTPEIRKIISKELPLYGLLIKKLVQVDNGQGKLLSLQILVRKVHRFFKQGEFDHILYPEMPKKTFSKIEKHLNRKYPLLYPCLRYMNSKNLNASFKRDIANYIRSK